MKKTKLVATYGLLIAIAFTLSFLESLVPINIGVPGVKLGFSNIVVMYALYSMKRVDAFAVSMIRILITGLVFSGAFSLSYSFAGGILSLVIMMLLYRLNKMSVIGVSVVGAVMHNLGQIIVAGVVMHTSRIIYYFPVLLISGVVTGVIVGILSGIIITRLNKINNSKLNN